MPMPHLIPSKVPLGLITLHHEVSLKVALGKGMGTAGTTVGGISYVVNAVLGNYMI